MSKVVKLESVTHKYSNKYTEELVLNDVNLELTDGKLYCIMGPSGSGKTTLLNIIGGLLHPTEGQVWIDEQDITQYSKQQLADLRMEKIGFIFQNFNLIPFLTVKENIFLQVKLAKKNPSAYMNDYEQIMDRLGLRDKEKSYVHELSGGQQQRVAIARGLLTKPSIILADEPTGNLDASNTKKFLDIIRDVNKNTNILFIIVTHDQTISDYCDETITINEGKVYMKFDI